MKNLQHNKFPTHNKVTSVCVSVVILLHWVSSQYWIRRLKFWVTKFNFPAFSGLVTRMQAGIVLTFKTSGWPCGLKLEESERKVIFLVVHVQCLKKITIINNFRVESARKKLQILHVDAKSPIHCVWHDPGALRGNNSPSWDNNINYNFNEINCYIHCMQTSPWWWPNINVFRVTQRQQEKNYKPPSGSNT